MKNHEIDRKRLLIAAAGVGIVCVILGLWISGSGWRQFVGPAHRLPGQPERSPYNPLDREGGGLETKVRAGAKEEPSEVEERQAQDFRALLEEYRRINQQAPDYPDGLMKAINPYNDRNAKAFAAAKAIEEKLTSAELAYRDAHEKELEAFQVRQAALLLPQSILSRLQSAEIAGDSTVGDTAAMLLEHPASFQAIIDRLKEGGADTGGAMTVKTPDALIAAIEEAATKLAPAYQAAAASIPPGLREFYQAENAKIEEAFWTQTYYRYLIRDMLPANEAMNAIVQKLQAALDQLPRDSETKAQLATELSDTLREETR